MSLKRRNLAVYGVMLVVWALVIAWQADEHIRVKETAKAELRNRSQVIANFLSAVIRGLRFRGAILQEKIEPVLKVLVNERTNELGNTSELISIALLNTAGDPVITAGPPIDFSQKDVMSEREHWGPRTVIFVNPVEGWKPEGESNATVVLPGFREFTNTIHEGRGRDFHHEPRPEGEPPGHSESNGISAGPNGPPPGGPGPEPPQPDSGHPPHPGPGEPRFRDRGPGPHRPPWLRWMDEKEFESLIEKRELHGLVLAMSTKNYRATSLHDLWLRYVIVFFAGAAMAGVGLAWLNLARTSELQIRLVRASELNSHLKQMNLAAAGLAHETRNPLNIIRGMAQMISKQTEAPPEIRDRSRAIVDETDKVTAQLNEFINYSRPREVRRTVLSLAAAVNEVVRALGYDIEEKKVLVGFKGEQLSIEADEQLLRQALFNLVLNAVQAVDSGGEIQIVAQQQNADEASLEIRDNGLGVPPDRREEIFKPYFTMQQKGTGLGLAVVQQIVRAHGWEIECLANEPKGANFRITHLKLAAR